jgi:hypothetical protein
MMFGFRWIHKALSPNAASDADIYSAAAVRRRGGGGGADGTPRQLNDGKWPFRMEEDGKGNVVVDIEFPRFMDTSLLDVDVQPTYFRVTVRRPEKRDRVIQARRAAAERTRGVVPGGVVGGAFSVSCDCSYPCGD